MALRRALAGADSALIHDALSDAESHLRAERASPPNESEEAILRSIVSTNVLEPRTGACLPPSPPRTGRPWAPSRQL